MAAANYKKKRLYHKLNKMTSNSGEYDDPCRFAPRNDDQQQQQHSLLPPFPPRVNLSATPVRPKEAILILLTLLLLVCSILLFYKHWKKNYQDINHLPYYAYLYQKDPDELLPVTPVLPPVVAGAAPGSMDLWKVGGGRHNHCTSADNINIMMSRSHSSCVSPAFLSVGVPPVPLPQRGMIIKPQRPFLAPKRAASDVYTRFNSCRYEVMRQMQVSLEEVEETKVAVGAAAEINSQLGVVDKVLPEEAEENCNSVSTDV